MKVDWEPMWKKEYYELDTDLDKMVWAYSKLQQELIMCRMTLTSSKRDGKTLMFDRVEHEV